MQKQDNLETLIDLWADLKSEYDDLKSKMDAIQEEINAKLKENGLYKEGSEIFSKKARLVVKKGRGKYDYETLAKELSPPKEVVKKYAEVVVDWKMVCKACGAKQQDFDRVYTPGEPIVALELNKLK